MVNSLADGADADLRLCVEEQSSVFEQAVVLIERLEVAAERRELGSPDSVTQLQKSLDRVVTAQKKVSAAQGRFASSQMKLTSDLRRTLERHENLLKMLIGRIDNLQTIFETVRGELAPRLDTETRRRSMQAAYQKSMKQGTREGPGLSE
jgi:hypothetical protein